MPVCTCGALGVGGGQELVRQEVMLAHSYRQAAGKQENEMKGLRIKL